MRESRYHQRHSVSGKFFAHIMASGFCSLGMVRDISSSGICYDYLDCGTEHPGIVTLHLFSSLGFSLRGIRCTLVHEHVDQPSILNSTGTRVCGLRFQDLTREQKRSLSSFFARYAYIINITEPASEKYNVMVR